MKALRFKCSMWMLSVLVVAGCATNPKPQEKIVFPPPPETPRYEWLGTIYTNSDIEANKNPLADMLVGDARPQIFSGPIDVVSTSDGRILVSDVYKKIILGLNMETGRIAPFTDASFNNLIGLAVDSQDRVYAADNKAGKVKVFSGSGQPLFTIGGQDIPLNPLCLAVNDSLARLYVSDTTDHAIKVFSLDGEFLFQFGQKGNAEGDFHSPGGLAVDGQGQLFVADMMNARIQVFSADGEFIRMFGKRGTLLQDFEFPRGLAFDSDGNLYVVDSRRPNLRVFTPEGVLLLLIGSSERESHKLGFVMPVGVYVDGRDRVLIADLMNQRLTVWQYLSNP